MSSNRKNLKSGKCIFPNYRYCGPGCSGPGAPLNDVDACCKAHDQCYRRYGSRCECDRMFLKCLKSKVNTHSGKGVDAALMYAYMKLQVAFNCGPSKRKNP